MNQIFKKTTPQKMTKNLEQTQQMEHMPIINKCMKRWSHNIEIQMKTITYSVKWLNFQYKVIFLKVTISMARMQRNGIFHF